MKQQFNMTGQRNIRCCLSCVCERGGYSNSKSTVPAGFRKPYREFSRSFETQEECFRSKSKWTQQTSQPASLFLTQHMELIKAPKTRNVQRQEKQKINLFENKKNLNEH